MNSDTSDRFQEALHVISSTSSAHDGIRILSSTCQIYELKNVAYLGINLPCGEKDLPYSCVTYSTEWVMHYIAKNYLRIDPVIRMGLNSIIPVDWAESNRSDPEVRQLFGEAKDAGVGANGLTIPVRGRHGEIGMLSITTDEDDRFWSMRKPKLSRDMLSIGYMFHNMVLAQIGVSSDRKMSPNEIECLKWAAQGKSFQDIAVIMNISHRRVKFYLDLARTKLNCMNITHAVAKAIAEHHISATSE